MSMQVLNGIRILNEYVDTKWTRKFHKFFNIGIWVYSFTYLFIDRSSTDMRFCIYFQNKYEYEYCKISTCTLWVSTLRGWVYIFCCLYYSVLIPFRIQSWKNSTLTCHLLRNLLLGPHLLCNSTFASFFFLHKCKFWSSNKRNWQNDACR